MSGLKILCVCVPVVDVEEEVYWSLLFLLICTVHIKHTREETTAPRPHSAWLYMDDSPPGNKQNVYLNRLYLLTLSKVLSGEKWDTTRVCILSFVFNFYISNIQEPVIGSILAVTLARRCKSCSVIFMINHRSLARSHSHKLLVVFDPLKMSRCT